VPIVHVPTPLRGLTGGAATVRVAGSDVRAVLVALEGAYPGIADRLVDERGDLRRYVHVFVRDDDVRALAGLDTPVEEDDLVAIVPAVAGGAGRGATPRWRRRGGRGGVSGCCP
jgi:sulfur-carrier protein